MNIKNRIIFSCSVFFSFFKVNAQTVNEGQLYITPNSLVSTFYNFENSEQGDFRNNGVFIVHKDIVNDGKFFDYDGNKPQGKTILKGSETQKISGTQLTKFNNLVLDNDKKNIAFDVKGNVIAEGNVEFVNGIAVIDDSNASFTFLTKAQAIGANDKSHIKGEVEKEGNTNFVFPIGANEVYRSAGISAPKNKNDVFVSKYFYEDETFFANKIDLPINVNVLNTKEYWLIDRGNKSNSDVVITLSWDERTTPEDMTEDPEKFMCILRWDNQNKTWVDEGGIVDMSTKTISSPTSVIGYGYFTLGSIKPAWVNKEDLIVYNLVSANKDGMNDYFLIENIQLYPNNRVTIFNRWGTKVFDTKEYDSKGNVFDGRSDGSGTLKKGERLPSGTYFYILNYEVQDSNGSKVKKKSGYLHLE